jgi:hypothetical protein
MSTIRKGENRMKLAESQGVNASECYHRDEVGFKEFGRWLNSAIHLRANRHTKKREVIELAKALLGDLGINGYMKTLKWLALICILSNLFLATWLGVPVMFSRNYHHYQVPKRYRYDFYTRHHILPIVNKLQKEGFIEVVPGRHDLGKMSRMWATGKLLDRLEELSIEDIEKLPPPDPVIMTKRIRKGNRYVHEPTTYTDNAKTEGMRRFLHSYNRLLEEACVEIELPPETYRTLSEKAVLYYIVMARGVTLDREVVKLLDTLYGEEREDTVTEVISTHTSLLSFSNTLSLNYKSLHRVFNRESWETGGRFYGSEAQTLPKELRQYLLINGEATEELDFSAMHLRMLYHRRGLEVPREHYDSPYDFGKGKALNKLAVLIIVNCEPEQDEVKAISAAFRDDRELRRKFGDGILKHDFVRQLIADFKVAHPAIADDFFSGCGLKLQYRDSVIMEDILKHFVRKGVPIIPVHDSLIVTESHADEARQVMNEVYKDHMGFDAVIG